MVPAVKGRELIYTLNSQQEFRQCEADLINAERVLMIGGGLILLLIALLAVQAYLRSRSDDGLATAGEGLSPAVRSFQGATHAAPATAPSGGGSVAGRAARRRTARPAPRPTTAPERR